MVYEALLLIGAIGLLAQTVLGFAHGGGSGHATAGHASTGHSATLSPGGANLHAHGHLHVNNHLHVNVNAGSFTRSAAALLFSLLSPLAIFSICLGAGVAGLAAEALRERPVFVIFVAVAGGIVFYGGLVRPLWKLIFRFASKPAATLAGAVAAEAVAVSRFDTRGRGVVRLTVDGQTTRVLANLDAEERAQADTVAPGDHLLVTSVDRKKNTCRVTRLS